MYWNACSLVLCCYPVSKHVTFSYQETLQLEFAVLLFMRIFDAVASKLSKKSPIGSPREIFLRISYNGGGGGLIFESEVRMEKPLSDLNEACSVLEASSSVHVKKIASIFG